MFNAASTSDIPFGTQTDWMRPGAYVQQQATSTESSSGREFKFILLDGKLVGKDQIPARYKSTLDAVKEHIRQMIDMARVPDHWISEGVKPPSKQCRKKSLDVTTGIFSAHGLLPTGVYPSIEEGIMLFYWNNTRQRSLKIEIYNDGGIAGLINQGENIVLTMDNESGADLEVLINGFIKPNG